VSGVPARHHECDSTFIVTPAVRASKYGHVGVVVWFTGLPCSGKSTLARALESHLVNRGVHVAVLDGDDIRGSVNSDLGFSAVDRRENVRRVAEIARLLAHAGTVAVAALVSPYEQDRQAARAIVTRGDPDALFCQVFLDVPVATCERRDVRGWYAKARANLASEFTGISAPYQAPRDSEITLRTDEHGVDACVSRLMDFLAPRIRRDVREGDIASNARGRDFSTYNVRPRAVVPASSARRQQH